MKLDMLDLNLRGDENFDALTEIEKNLYVLFLFETLDEMEGVTHFFSHHSMHLPRLLAFLADVQAPNYRVVENLAHFFKDKAGGTWDPDALEKFVCSMSKKDRAQIEIWDDEYYSKVEEMWACTEEYLHEHHQIEIE